MKAKGLGRGLDALLAAEEGATQAPSGLKSLKVAQIKPGRYQPRTRMDQASLAELAQSIKAQGVIQPIIVRQEKDRFEIIAGERRWRAAQMAGLAEVPAIVREISNDAVLATSLIENIQREDLNPLEEASGIRRLVNEFAMTHDRAAQAIGRSRSAVTNLLRLLELAPLVQEMLMDGRLDMGHARALLGLAPAKQLELARRIEKRALSVREAERLVKGAGHRKPRATKKDQDVVRLQEELSDQLGTKVIIKPGKKGRGRLVIDYTSLEQLDAIIEKLS
jgi:ParB family chromosome partitioning protein